MKITKTELRNIIRKTLIESHKNRFNFSRDYYGQDWFGPTGTFDSDDAEIDDVDESIDDLVNK